MAGSSNKKTRGRSKSAERRKKRSETTAPKLAVVMEAEVSTPDETLLSITSDDAPTPPPSEVDEANADSEPTIEVVITNPEEKFEASSEEDHTDTPDSDESPGKATAEDKAAFAEFRKLKFKTQQPASPPKAPTLTTSSTPAHPLKQSLQVLVTGSRFADVNTFKCMSPDIQDLFDESDDSDLDTKRSLEDMCRANKKRRRRLLKSVKRFSRQPEIRIEQQKKDKKRHNTNLDTAKQDLADQKKI